MAFKNEDLRNHLGLPTDSLDGEIKDYDENSKALADQSYVQTPVEVREFIINSVRGILKSEFGKDLDDSEVHVLDPFSGKAEFLSVAADMGALKKDGKSKITQIEVDPERAKMAKDIMDEKLPSRVRTVNRDTFTINPREEF